jgi:hypothetical protein
MPQSLKVSLLLQQHQHLWSAQQAARQWLRAAPWQWHVLPEAAKSTRQDWQHGEPPQEPQRSWTLRAVVQ